MDPLSSADALIKFLRGPSPWDERLSAAERAWGSTDLYLPGRHAFLCDWIFQLMSDDSVSDTSILMEPRCWELLERLLGSADTAHRAAWLAPILTRRKAHNLLLLLIRHIREVTQPTAAASASVLTTCLVSPFNVFTDQQSQELAWDVLDYARSHSSALLGHCQPLCRLALVVARTRLPLTKDKQLLYETFTELHLDAWLICIHSLPSDSILRQTLWNFGTTVLFGTHEGLLATLAPRSQTNPSPHDLWTAYSRCMASDDSQIFAIALDATVLLLKEFLNAVHRTKEDISELIRHATVTSRIKMKVAAMDFVGKLMGCALDVSLDRAQDLGRMRVAIFRFVLENDLLDASLATTANVLAMEVQSAVSQLTSAVVRKFSFELLSIIVRFDYYLIEKHTPNILNIAYTADGVEAAEFLRCVLDYHSKSRTLNTYLLQVAQVISYRDYQSDPNIQGLIGRGSLLSPAHTRRLRIALASFLPPSQTLDLIHGLYEVLQRCICDWFPHAKSTGPELAALELTREPSSANALKFFNVTMFVSEILPTLPFRTLKGHILEEVRRIMSDLQGLVYNDSVIVNLVAASSVNGGLQCSYQTVLSAFLNLRSAFRTLYSVESSRHHLSREASRFPRLLSSQGVLPRLQVAILRHIFCDPMPVSVDPTQDALSYIVQMAGAHIQDKSQLSWDGTLAALDESPAALAIALFDQLAVHWLPSLELHGSEATLEQFAELLLTSFSMNEGDKPSALTLASIARRFSTSSQFFEMRRIRGAIQAIITKQTSELGNIDVGLSVQTLLVRTTAGGRRALGNDQPGARIGVQDESHMDELLSPFRLLAGFPDEYFGRTTRSIIVKRATALDIAIGSWISEGDGGGSTRSIQSLVIVRSFIERMGSTSFPMANIEVANYICYSLKFGSMVQDQGLRQEYEDKTFALLGRCYRQICNLGHDIGSIKYLFQHFSASTSVFQEGIADAHPRKLWEEAFLDLVDKVLTHRTLSPNDLVSVLGDLGARYDDWLSRAARKLRNDLANGSSRSLDELDHLFVAWRTRLRISQCIPHGVPLPTEIASLVVGLMKAVSNVPLALTSSVGMHFLELMLAGQRYAGSQPIDVVIATYLAVTKTMAFKEPAAVLSILEETITSLTPTDFDLAVNIAIDYSTNELYPGIDSYPVLGDLSAVLDVFGSLIVSAPEGCAKSAHRLMAVLIPILSGDRRLESSTANFEEDVCAVFRILEFLRTICRRRITSLDDVTVGYLLGTLNALLCPRTVSTPRTSLQYPPAIFSTICDILVMLVRNQRGRLMSHVPDFTKLICLLINALKTAADPPRLPFWLESDHTHVETGAAPTPWWLVNKLGVADAAQLNRLLKSMEIKSFVSGGAKLMERKSLASEFSRHAPYILTAYVKTITSSYGARASELTTLARPIRLALREGIFGLCGMVGDRGRQGVMKSLNDEGKEIFKDIWAQYEKQRYTGTG